MPTIRARSAVCVSGSTAHRLHAVRGSARIAASISAGGEAGPGPRRNVGLWQKRAKRISQGRVGSRSIAGRLRQASQDDSRKPARNLGTDGARRLRRLRRDAREQLADVRSIERRLPGQQVVQRRADGVDVRAYVERFAAQLFGRRKLRRPLESGGGQILMDVAGQRRHGQAEVTDLDAAVVIHETVRRLDVAVKNAGSLRRVQAADDVEHGCRRLFGGQWPVCDDAVLQCAARQQLHRDDGHAGDFVTAEDVDRMWMTDRRGELSFAQESGTLLGSLQPAPQDLQRDAPSAVGAPPRRPRPSRRDRAAGQSDTSPTTVLPRAAAPRHRAPRRPQPMTALASRQPS